MQNHSLPEFVVIEGNIGAGKTTFATKLAEATNRRLILESFSDNPFLAPFYEQPERYALPVELFFMTERHKQLSAELARADLFTDGVVADYLFVKTLLFARNTLTEDEYRLFGRIFGTMDAGFPDPDLIVYLHRPLAALRQNIAKRGRAYEQGIETQYLASVERAYHNYFKTQKEVPVLILDLGSRDFVSDRVVYGEMLSAISQKQHLTGVNTVTLSTQP